MARFDDLPPEIIIQIFVEVGVDDLMEPAWPCYRSSLRFKTCTGISPLMRFKTCTGISPLMLFRHADDETDNLSSLIMASERVHQVYRQNRYAIFQQLVRRLVELRDPGSTNRMPANMVVYQQLSRLDETKKRGLASALAALVSGISVEEKDTLLQSLRNTQIDEVVNHTLFRDILEAIRDRYDGIRGDDLGWGSDSQADSETSRLASWFTQ